jgi:hypothetical protein
MRADSSLAFKLSCRWILLNAWINAVVSLCKIAIERLLPELLAAVVIIKKQDSQLNFHIALANDELREWAKVLADKVNVPISIGVLGNDT